MLNVGEISVNMDAIDQVKKWMVSLNSLIQLTRDLYTPILWGCLWYVL